MVPASNDHRPENRKLGGRYGQREEDGTLQARQWNATPRQEEILELLWNGLGDKEVADRLNIGDRTVRTHLEILRRRWRQRSRIGLLRTWQELKAEQRRDPQHFDS